MAKDTVSNTLIDKRVVERNIKKGFVTRETYDKYLHALPDVAAQSEKIQARLGEDDDFGDEEEDDIDDVDGEDSDTPEG